MTLGNMRSNGVRIPFSICHTSSIRLPGLYYFFLAVVVIRYETTATARWALLFIVRAFFNDTITVAVWTGFGVRSPNGATITAHSVNDDIKICRDANRS
jgi:hypothetical protein